LTGLLSWQFREYRTATGSFYNIPYMDHDMSELEKVVTNAVKELKDWHRNPLLCDSWLSDLEVEGFET
jgi:hypothetical protein